MNLCIELRGIDIRHLVALISFICILIKIELYGSLIFIKSFVSNIFMSYHHHSKKEKIFAPKI